MPILADGPGVVHKDGHPLEEALQAGVEPVEVQGHAVKIIVIARTLSTLPSLLHAIERLAYGVDGVVDALVVHPRRRYDILHDDVSLVAVPVVRLHTATIEAHITPSSRTHPLAHIRRGLLLASRHASCIRRGSDPDVLYHIMTQ